MKTTGVKELLQIDINSGDRYSFEDRYVSTRIYLGLTEEPEEGQVPPIGGYGNNRAGTPLNQIHVEKIAENLYTPALGMFPIAMNPKTGTWSIYDGHNRTDALHERNNNGDMSEEELDSLILLRVVPYKYALEMYVHINNTEKHTNNNKLFNPDLPAGKFLEDILEKANIASMLSNWKRQVFNQAFAIAQDDFNADYKKVSQAYASKAAPCLNTPPSVRKGKVIDNWNEKSESYTIFALKKTKNAYDKVLEVANNQFTKDLKVLVKSGRFFGIILNYATSTKPEHTILFKNLEQLATNIIVNAKELGDIISNYTKETDIREKALYSLLKTNMTKTNKKTPSVGFKSFKQESKDEVSVNN